MRALVLLLALAACKSGTFVTVEVANLPCGTEQLFVTVTRDGITVDHTFNGVPSGRSSTSFVLDLSDQSSGVLEVTVDARGAGGSLGFSNVSVPVAAGTITVDLNGVTCEGGGIDANPCGWALLPSNFDPCMIGSPAGTWEAANTFDTNTGTGAGAPVAATPVILAGNVAAMRIYVDSFHVAMGATFTQTGAKPLIIVANTISIEGTIVVQSTGDFMGCATAPGETAPTCGTGGAGGSFGGEGGAGGTCSTSPTNTTQAAVTSTLVPLRGGCSGGRSKNLCGLAAANGGAAGGALQLAAKTSIVVTGTINANGVGGTGGETGGGCANGGGGGGSGGAIFLEAPDVAVNGSAKLCANGGSGGGGGGNPATNPGVSGSSACTVTITLGGGATSNGGNGGANGYRANPNGQPGVSVGTVGGGGGGGGGVGIIRVRTLSATPVSGSATVSPAEVQ